MYITHNFLKIDFGSQTRVISAQFSNSLLNFNIFL